MAAAEVTEDELIVFATESEVVERIADDTAELTVAVLEVVAETATEDLEKAEHIWPPTDAARSTSDSLQAERRHGVTALWMAGCLAPHWHPISVLAHPAAAKALTRQGSCDKY